jgi:hypothetical protein
VNATAAATFNPNSFLQMNPPLRPVLLALAFGSLCFILSLQAAGMNSDVRLARLDQLVGLTSDQKAKAAQIFQTEDQSIEALAPNDRLVKGSDARQSSRQQIRALLTPPQRNKFDLAPQTMGGGLRTNPDNLVDRLHQLLNFSAEQKQRAREILWNELADQLAAVPEGGELPGFRWRDATRDQLRAILTPEQLAKYNSTPQIQGGGGKMGGLAPKGN